MGTSLLPFYPTSTTTKQGTASHLFSTPKLRGRGRRCTTTTVTCISAGKQSHWATANAAIESHLLSTIPNIIHAPPSVTDPLHRIAFFTPRTLAPALCLMACELVGGSREFAIDTACALHLMYSASYVHDNVVIPGGGRHGSAKMDDNAHLRQIPAGIRILTGDGLYPLGYQMVGGGSNAGAHPELVLRVVVEMAEAMGPKGMMMVGERVEGALYACGGACGAVLGGGGEEEVEKLRRYGFLVGKIHGLLKDSKKEEKEREKEKLEEMKSKAVAEVEGFERGRKIDAILELLDYDFEYELEPTMAAAEERFSPSSSSGWS